MMDEIQDAEITVKAIANQWYNSNAVNKSKFFANRKKILNLLSSKYSSSNLDPSWVTGFTDAEGCFSINIQYSKRGRYISSTFKIAQDYKDIEIQYNQKIFFGTGQITIHKNEARQEIMGYKNAIEYIIPHFDKYPLITRKYADYVQWKSIIIIQNSRQHFTEDGFLQCLALKAGLNKGLNDKQKNMYPSIVPVIRPETIQPDRINPYWQSGFTAGDGSFMIIIRKQSTTKIGYQVYAGFNIGQHVKDVKLLYKIKEIFSCGYVPIGKNDSRIVINKLEDIRNCIIPHYTKYPLMNIKNKGFLIWCEIIGLIIKGEHQTQKGLNKIRDMREQMRKG